MFKSLAFTGLLIAAPLMTTATMAAADIVIDDPYARAASPIAKSGAAFFVIENTGPEDDRLVAAAAPIAKRVELHTHTAGDNGVMRMHEVEGGIPVSAGGEARLERGGLHVMFMGLTQPMEDGGSFPLTLTFEKAGDMTIEVPVDLMRQPNHGDMGN